MNCRFIAQVNEFSIKERTFNVLGIEGKENPMAKMGKTQKNICYNIIVPRESTEAKATALEADRMCSLDFRFLLSENNKGKQTKSIKFPRMLKSVKFPRTQTKEDIINACKKAVETYMVSFFYIKCEQNVIFCF